METLVTLQLECIKVYLREAIAGTLSASIIHIGTALLQILSERDWPDEPTFYPAHPASSEHELFLPSQILAHFSPR